MLHRFVCGTLAVDVRGPQDYRVVCASCSQGGTVQHLTRSAATQAAIRDSSRPCPARRPCSAR